MKPSIRPPRASSSFLIVLALVTAIAARAAEPASGCTVLRFEIVGGLDDSRKATVGQRVSFGIWVFPLGYSSHVPNTGSVNIDYGDGTAEDTGPRTFDPPSVFELSGITSTHVYTKPGTFTASVKGGRVQPCEIDPRVNIWTVTVLGNPDKMKAINVLPKREVTEVTIQTQEKNYVPIAPASGKKAKARSLSR